MTNKEETFFDLSALFLDINRSFTAAAKELHETFHSEEWKEHPFVYHMPKMHVSISLELSHKNGKVKGLFRKHSSERTEQLASNIEVDVVSVPRRPPVNGGSES
ncbi:MAG: hypothetical protein AAFZ65_15080 [Planctomycetota bacterium]